MAKNYIHDIKPSRRTVKARESHERAHEMSSRKMEKAKKATSRSKKEGGKGVWWVAAITIIILIFALSVVFSGATVTVSPRVGTVELSGLIEAVRESNNTLAFEMLVLDAEESASITTETKEFVEKRAEGKVIFYNNHGISSQNLLIDTRLETENGDIYKTIKAITIPGMTDGEPGVLEVEVYADEPGSAYNLEEGTLKILGFRGAEKYDTFHAEISTPIIGGMTGEMYTVPDEELESQVSLLKAELRVKLLANAASQIPQDFVMYEDVSIIEFDSPQIDSENTNGQVNITQKGKLNTFIFKEEDLTKELVKSIVADFDQNKVSIPEIKNLNIKLDIPEEIVPSEVTKIRLSVDDSVTVVWEIDNDVLVSDLVGIKKRDFNSTMLTYKNIDRAELDLRPFWKSTLPESISAIKIINSFTD